MAAIHTSLLESRHGYTGSKAPWIIDSERETADPSRCGVREEWRLYHYLSGNGFAFGRTVEQEERAIRQRRFLMVSAVLAGLWLLAWIF